VEGWGETVDPAGDCEFEVKEGRLRITVPGSEKPHDLSPELESGTAPRVLRPVKGDFVLQVKVGGEFEPGDNSTQQGRTPYNGAGLVVFADEKNFVRLERAALQGAGQSVAYPNFEIRVDGRLEGIGVAGGVAVDRAKPMWLKLERHGDEIRGAISQDGGEHWQEGAPKKLTAKAWAQEGAIKAGVAAISTATKPFTAVYSDLSVTDGEAAKAAAAPKDQAGEAKPK
jgi:regulation of enolase protein 1 (concanavalin A-like superfamily)